jgi:dihydrolipoamide dehydrogenase
MIYDVAFLGGGPGGYVGAIRGGQLGAKVCVVEQAEVGGTCLNRGCIPSKSFYASARRMDMLRDSAAFGVKFDSPPGFDLSACVDRKDGVVGDLVGSVEKLLKGNGVELVRGRGVMSAPDTIRVTEPDGKHKNIRARNIIISTGSRPMDLPGLPIDGELIVNSDQIWRLRDLPKRMVIVGGGVIGCELAHIFRAFGTEIKVIELLDRILSTEDKEASRVVHKSFTNRGIDVRISTRVQGAAVAGKEVAVTLSTGEEIRCDRVVVAVGRRPNADSIGMDKAEVELDEKGFIPVNDEMETRVPGIYAVGDVVGKGLLAHVATSEAMVAVHNALGKKYWMDYSIVPRATFTSPEVASVGASEAEIKENGEACRVGRFAFAASGKAVCMGETEGFMKILSSEETGRILGATIVGVNASDIIHEVAIAMRMEASPGDIVTTIHVHPTISEVVLEASEDTMGLAIHKIGRKSSRES